MQPITTLERKNCNKEYKPDYYMTTSFTIKNAKTDLQPWGTRIATSIRSKLLHDYIRKGFQLDRLT
jgi:hypothetical protein